MVKADSKDVNCSSMSSTEEYLVSNSDVDFGMEKEEYGGKRNQVMVHSRDKD